MMRFVNYFGKQPLAEGSVIRTKSNEEFVVINKRLNLLEGDFDYQIIKFDFTPSKTTTYLPTWFKRYPLTSPKDYPISTIRTSDIISYANKKIDKDLVVKFYNDRCRASKERQHKSING